MKKENKKDYLIAFFWLIMGYICWIAGLYSFSYGTSRLVTPVYIFLNKTFYSKLILDTAGFILFYGTDIFFITIFAFLLSAITGKKRARLLFFLLGALGYSLYGTIQSTIFYFRTYAVLPSWIETWLFKSIISYLILSPLLAWVGGFWGHRYYEKRNA